MQNRNVIWVFTVLLTLACIYQLSFSWVTSSVESDADIYAEEQKNLALQLDTSIVEVGTTKYVIKDSLGQVDEIVAEDYQNAMREQYLLEKSNQSVYPIFGHTYKYCKDNELAKGLDLEGGMSVALEVSIPEMVENLAGRNARKNSFAKPYESAYAAYTAQGNDKDFITLFDEKVRELSPNEKLITIFNLKDEDGSKLEEASNEEVLAILRDKASDALDKTKIVIENRINGLGVNQPSIQKNSATGRLLIDLPGVKDKERARKLLQSTARLEFWHTYKNTQIGNQIFEDVNKILSDRMFPGYRDSVERAEDTTNTIEDSTKVEEPIENNVAAIDTNKSADSGALAFDDSIIFNDSLFDGSGAEGTQADDQEKFRKLYPLSAYLMLNVDGENKWVEGPVLGYAKITDTGKVNELLSKEYVKKTLNRDLEFMWEANSSFSTNDGVPLLSLYLIKKTRNGIPELDGEEVIDARQDYEPGTTNAMVTLMFKSAGGAAWADMTEQSAADGTGIAITLDNKVFSAPVASGRIEGGSTQITGGSFVGPEGTKEAKDLANILKAGALPAPAKIVDESLIGPTLGAENVQSGLWSFGIAILLVLVYMMFFYSKGGVVADIALIANIFFIFGTLASLGAALTLPGIAGIVLTIGMSVDANVLVFERIREEIRLGKSTKAALEVGYSKALSAILDANVTTLLTAIILGYFGSGPIKGFATTLIIGIFTSLFSALVITRLIFSYMMDGKGKLSFSTKLTEGFLTKANWKFVARRKIFYVLSGLIIAGGIFSLVSKGLDYGVEFTGGRTYKVLFNEKEANFEELRNGLADAFGEKPEVKMIDNKYKALITTQYLRDDKTADGNEKVEAKLKEGLISMGMGNYEMLESRQVDPGISEDFKQSSIFAIIFSLIVIFLYILLRFRKWQFGFGALLAMFHDVIIVLSLFSIFWGVLPFSMEIDQAFIAAILTVVGYSINDTVVVFDRIREYLTEKRREDSSEVINKALNSTLGRTVNTSVTTFLVLLIIFIFGGESIKGMTFALMVGVVVGTYSSLCIATPSVVDLSRGFDFKKKQKL